MLKDKISNNYLIFNFEYLLQIKKIFNSNFQNLSKSKYMTFIGYSKIINIYTLFREN